MGGNGKDWVVLDALAALDEDGRIATSAGQSRGPRKRSMKRRGER
jgi:hypothetical protein